MIDIDGSIRRAQGIVDKIRPMLADESPDVQGAALAQLLAIFIGGHAPPLRQFQRAMLLDTADRLVPVIVEEMIDEGRVPAYWREKS
jgi:hypothetical protein